MTSAEEILEIVTQIQEKNNEREEMYEGEDPSPDYEENKAASKHLFMDELYSVDGDTTILEMTNLNYEEFVKQYEIMEDHIKEFTSQRRGKGMKNKDMDLIFMLLSTMKIRRLSQKRIRNYEMGKTLISEEVEDAVHQRITDNLDINTRKENTLGELDVYQEGKQSRGIV